MKKSLFRHALSALVIGLFFIFNQSINAQSPLDGFDPNPNGAIYNIFVQPDGKIIISGEFTTVAPNGGAPVARNRLARFNPDGTLDTAFNAGLVNNYEAIYAIAFQPDGKILVGGSFTGIGGQPRNNIARLDAITGQADSFNPNASHSINTIALQADGKILAGGQFSSIGGQLRTGIARLDKNTGLADSFNAQSDSAVSEIVVQPDGKILVAGVFFGIGGQSLNKFLARLDAVTGLADSSFNPQANWYVGGITIQPD
jgi:uncharacterized delta-60 repeat protein